MAIPFAEIAAWLDVHGIRDADERARLCQVIRHMDSVFRQHCPRTPTAKP